MRLGLHLGDLLQVLLIVDTVPQHIAEVPQRPLERVRRALLLGLLKGRRLALAVLDVAIADVLVERAVAQCHAHDDRQAQRDLERLRVLVDKVHLDLLDGRRPPVEAKHLVGERDALLGRDVVHLLARGPHPRRQVLRPELLLEPRLQRGDLLRRVLGDARLCLLEGVDDGAVLVAWAIESGKKGKRQ